MTPSQPQDKDTAATPSLRCAGCNREFEVGDRFIVDTSSGFTKHDADPVVDDLIAGIFGGTAGRVRLCEDCTEPGIGYQFEIFYGDEEADPNG